MIGFHSYDKLFKAQEGRNTFSLVTGEGVTINPGTTGTLLTWEPFRYDPMWIDSLQVSILAQSPLATTNIQLALREGGSLQIWPQYSGEVDRYAQQGTNVFHLLGTILHPPYKLPVGYVCKDATYTLEATNNGVASVLLLASANLYRMPKQWMQESHNGGQE